MALFTATMALILPTALAAAFAGGGLLATPPPCVARTPATCMQLGGACAGTHLARLSNALRRKLHPESLACLDPAFACVRHASNSLRTRERVRLYAQDKTMVYRAWRLRARHKQQRQ